MEKINSNINEVMTDVNILPDHVKYLGRYLHQDIEREEIKLLHCTENVFFFQFEYFTSTTTIDDNIDFKNSKANITSTSGTGTGIKEENQIEESEFVKNDTDNTFTADFKHRPILEKEILKNNLENLICGAKLIYTNSDNVVENAKSTLIRYAILNSKAIFLSLL